jgi:hypothetical protein
MSEEEGFLHRWSRLKTEQPQPEPDLEPEPEDPAPELPPLESLGQDSDYTPFLHKAVPAALRIAALRTAWRSDPAIANFKGLAEYDWDCNAPGYGKLLPTDDVQAMCDRVFGNWIKKAEEEEEGTETGNDEKPSEV